MSFFGRLLGRHRPRWAETWQMFPGLLGDTPAQWTVDLGAVAAAPVSGLPVRMDVQAPYHSGADGLPVDPADIAQIEDAVRASAASLGGEYVGRVVGGGVCRLTAHLPAEPPTAPVIAGVAGAVVATAFDPHWAYVRDTLAPDERQQQMLADLAAVGLLSGVDDALATPRVVTHLAYFAALEPAEAAGVELRVAGFHAAVQRDDEGGFALTAARRDPVAPPAVHELSWLVRETVERQGGGYDGWSCDPARAGSPDHP